MRRVTIVSTAFVLALVIVGLSQTSLAGNLAAPDGLEARRPSGEQGLEAVAMRLIDGKIEVEVWLTDHDDAGHAVRTKLEDASAVTWTILEGDGRLYEDPGTGRTLFQPLGRETLVVQPGLGEMVGEPVVIGMEPDLAPAVRSLSGAATTEEPPPPEEESFDASGGGLCGHRMGPRMFKEPVDVRSVVSSSVIPVSPTERVVRYAHGEYYSYHPEVGPMRIVYNPDRTTEVRLKSLSENGEPFFPAKAAGQLYFEIQMLETGWEIANWEPMTIEATVLSWPPFDTPIVNQDGVSFFSVDQPDVEVHRIAYQEFYLYPTKEIAVNVETLDIDSDSLEATFELQNKTGTAGDIRWFIVGDLHEPLTTPRGLVHLEGEASEKVTFKTRLTQSALPQFITVGAVSETGPRLVGFKRVNFRVPPEAKDGGRRLLDQSHARLIRPETAVLAAK